MQESRQILQIFLDRTIYRPGHMVYFKVVNTAKNLQGSEVVPYEKQTVILTDANGKSIEKQTHTTNEFGSYSGSFVLPKNLLNGQFSISVNGKSAAEVKYFHVEEYKNPGLKLYLNR